MDCYTKKFKSDSFCLTVQNQLLEVVSILFDTESDKYALSGHLSQVKNPYFSEPCNSDILSIFHFPNTQQTTSVVKSLSDIRCKCQVFLDEQGLLAIPLLHHL